MRRARHAEPNEQRVRDDHHCPDGLGRRLADIDGRYDGRGACGRGRLSAQLEPIERSIEEPIEGPIERPIE